VRTKLTGEIKLNGNTVVLCCIAYRSCAQSCEQLLQVNQGRFVYFRFLPVLYIVGLSHFVRGQCIWLCFRSRLLINRPKFNARGSGYELERRFTKFVEITQSKSHYAIQGQSRSPILVPIESSCCCDDVCCMCCCRRGAKWWGVRTWALRQVAGPSETTTQRPRSAATSTMTSWWRHAPGSWSASDTRGAASHTTAPWRLTTTVGLLSRTAAYWELLDRPTVYYIM